MAISNLSELRTAIRDYLTEDNTTVLPDSRIDELIEFVEDDLNSMAKHPRDSEKKGFRLLEMQEVATTQIEENPSTGKPDPYVTIPDGFLDMRYITETSAPANGPLLYVTPQGLIEEERSGTGDLRVYTISAMNIRLPEGAVSTSTTLEMGYYVEIPPLTDAEPTNWLLTKSPRVYLYGALTFAPALLQDYSPQIASGLYMDAVVKLIDANEMTETTQGSTEVPPSYRVA